MSRREAVSSANNDVRIVNGYYFEDSINEAGAVVASPNHYDDHADF